MPPRLNKRQLRELEELKELEAAKQASTGAVALPEEDEVDSDEQEQVVVGKPQAGFGALIDDDQVEEESDKEEEAAVTTPTKKSKNKKKKKKAKPTAPSSPPADAPADADDVLSPEPEALVTSLETPSKPTSGSPKKKKKGGAKAGKKEDKPVKKVDDGMDEIDRALAELAVKSQGKDGEPETVAQAQGRVDPKWNALKDLFSFDAKYLDSDAELRRMFGSKVIGSAPAARGPSHVHARLANNPHHAASLRRTSSYLATPEPGWPSPAGVLQLIKYEGADKEEGGEWWTFAHSPSYKQAQLMFLEVLQQADGNRLFDVLAALPYHVDTLMQLSEMMAQQGDLGASSTHLTRALYALSAPLPATFPSGNFRLPYSQIENRALFLGIARKVNLLVKRGTWRTAFEWAKIALGMGGGEDPMGMLCWIDFLAPKAGQQDWFFKLLPSLDTAYPHMGVYNYPGLWYAKALCVRNEEEEAKSGNNDKSSTALRSAILRFPVVATLLSAALAFDLPPSMVTHKRAQPDGSFTSSPSYLLSLLSELYVIRSAPLWKDPASVAWLQKVIREAAPLLDDQTIEDVRKGERLWSEGPWEKGVAPAGIIRAAFIADAPSIRPYLPPSTRQGTTYSYDPLPPTSPFATFYNDAYFSSLYTSSSSYRQRGQRAAQRAPRGAGAGGGGAGGGAAAMQAMRDGLARLLGMGEGGPQVELNEELRAELFREFEALGGGGGGGMPGGFGGDEGEGEEGEEEWDDEDEEEGEGSGAGQGGLLARLGALFGGGQGAAGELPQEEEQRPE
ncbi:hypothetical protein JCM11641_007329 [Rhodosporidiobolus odoratus]